MEAFMRRTYISLLLLLLLGGIFLVLGAHAGSLRIALLDGAEVRGDVIVLADLLPKDVPRFIREVAEKISLGTAPQNGTSRRFSRSAVLAAVMAHGLPESAFEIPDVITVQRSAHLVTRGEAFAAIREALAKSKGPALPDFQPEDISLDAVLLPDRTSQLEVTAIAFDEFIGRARFRLRSKSAPGVHPFYVTARLPFRLAAIPSSSIQAFSAGFIASSINPPVVSPVLVEAGRTARLHLHSSNSNILLEVKPLQRGRLGEIIRVRLPGSGKTLRARVVEGGDLDAGF
jgi:hypothetical protein